MSKIKKFIKTDTKGEFINIDFIVAIKRSEFGYYVHMCDGLWYEIEDSQEAENLFEYLKSQVVAEGE